MNSKIWTLLCLIWLSATTFGLVYQLESMANGFELRIMHNGQPVGTLALTESQKNLFEQWQKGQTLEYQQRFIGTLQEPLKDVSFDQLIIKTPHPNANQFLSANMLARHFPVK